MLNWHKLNLLMRHVGWAGQSLRASSIVHTHQHVKLLSILTSDQHRMLSSTSPPQREGCKASPGHNQAWEASGLRLPLSLSSALPLVPTDRDMDS